MGDSKKLVKNSALYTLGNVLLKAFSFLLIPIYTSYLTTEDYGITSLVSGFTGLASCFITLGLQYAVIRFYADFKENKILVSRLFGTVIVFIILFGTILSVMLVVTQNIWLDIFFKNIPFVPIVLLSILISVVSALYSLYQDILKGMQDARQSVVLSFVFFFLLLIANIVTVVIYKKGAFGMVWSTFAVNAVMVVFMYVDLRRRRLFHFCLDLGLLKELLMYSLPLVPHTLSYNLTYYATRVLINSKLSLSSLGLFSLASQFGYVSDIILNSFQAAFQPWMFEKMKIGNKESKISIQKSTYSLLWVMGLIYLVVGTYSQEAIYIMADNRYGEAWRYVPLLVVSVALKSPLYFYTNFLYYNKSKTKYVFVATIVACILNIILTWVFIPLWGIYGSIIADIVSMVVRVIITVYLSWEMADGIYSFNKLCLLSFIPIVFMAFSILPSYFIFREELSISTVLYKLLIVVLYVLLAFGVNKNIIHNIKISKI